MNNHPERPSLWRQRGQWFLSVALLPGALVFAVVLAWWVSLPSTGKSGKHASGANNYPRARGPVSSSVCGPGALRQPPPFDSPLGRNLYANTRRGEIHPLPAMAIADALMPPPEALRHKGSSTAPQKPPAPPPPGAGVSMSSTPKNETAQDDVASVAQLLEEYRRVFGAMPTGEQNDEIVRCLQGNNPLGIAVLSQDHPALNESGELMDRWGTPYRFHPESAWVMTVRSAGPDKRWWTSDDITSMEGHQPTAQGLLTGTGQ